MISTHAMTTTIIMKFIYFSIDSSDCEDSQVALNCSCLGEIGGAISLAIAMIVTTVIAAIAIACLWKR